MLVNPPSIFISHSKHDKDLVDFFAKIFSRLKLAGNLMELEDMGGKYAGVRIADIIRSNYQENTRAVIVLLGKNLESPPSDTPQYTHNWVNFEVGVAAGCNKPVWVFEEMNKPIEFPIPYVTDYCQYELGNTEHLRQIGDFFTNLYLFNQQVKPVNIIKCQYCNASYNFWSQHITRMTCPVCRKLHWKI